MQQDIENFPIDIHFNKLLDWLISRRHCKQQWQVASLILRDKINAAVLDMPENAEIAKLLEGTHVNYFHCMKIVELLKITSCGEKNILGQYSSQTMKNWSDIIKLYEKDDMYLAETAQMLMRNVNYEIPAIKKQIAKCQQVQKECDRKQVDYASKSADLKKKYSNNCKDLGIKGEKIKSELSALVQDLPKVFDKIAFSTQQLDTAIKYYQDFSRFLLNRPLQDSECLGVLRFMQEKGNTVTYEWTHGCKPARIDEASIVIDTKDEDDVVVNTDDIDWGQIDVSQSNDDFNVEVDFDISGITVEGGGTDEGKVNIDLGMEQLGEEIDWGDSEDAVVPMQTEILSKDIATGEQALTILDNPKTRNLFLDDLLELEAFLTQRLAELLSHGNSLSSSQIHIAPASIQIDEKQVEEMVTDVKNIITQLTSVQLQHLMMIRNSPRYVERLKDSLRQLLTLADKMVFYEKEMISKRNEAIEEERELLPKLDVLIKRTKEMQLQMEVEISKRYKNRPVNIMGEINTI